MYELTYESVASDGTKSTDIEQILETSRSDNGASGVTGCLIFYNGKFIQILEGEEDKVREIYGKIRSDKRHRNVRLIAENAMKERTFSEWGMAYFPIDEEYIGRADLEQFRRNLKLLGDFSRRTTVTTILFWKKVHLLVSEKSTYSLG